MTFWLFWKPSIFKQNCCGDSGQRLEKFGPLFNPASVDWNSGLSVDVTFRNIHIECLPLTVCYSTFGLFLGSVSVDRYEPSFFSLSICVQLNVDCRRITSYPLVLFVFKIWANPVLPFSVYQFFVLSKSDSK